MNILSLFIALPITVFATTINGVADNMVGQLLSVYSLIGMANYVAGFCFICASIFKFKQHKDNPQQQTIGNPLTYMLIGILLMYMGEIILPIGQSIFGSGGLIRSNFR